MKGWLKNVSTTLIVLLLLTNLWYGVPHGHGDAGIKAITVEKWRVSVARCFVDNTWLKVYSNSLCCIPSTASLSRDTSPSHCKKMLDLYSELPLGRQQWTDQQNENENAPSVFVFLKWRFKYFLWHELPRSQATI